MMITRFTDYALRVMAYLGLKDPEPATIKEIAERYDISKNHLMKVVHMLSEIGFVHTTRGKNGGIRLSRAAELINIGQIVRTLEQHSVLVECFGNNNQCVLTPSCRLKHWFAEAMENFFLSLEKYTLADLLHEDQQQDMIRLLAIPMKSPA